MEIQSDQGNGQAEGNCPTDSVLIEDLQGLDMKLIQLLDSTDDYLKLYYSLSQTMRQGWLEIAGARYSMGPSRISEALFSLKPHPAYTLISAERTDDVDATDENCAVEKEDEKISMPGVKQETCFKLHKWENKEEVGFKESRERSTSQLRHRHLSHFADKDKGESKDKGSLESSSNAAVSQVQRRKSEALSLFGTLVSPQLRSAQISFEKVLETLVEIANVRNTILSVLAQISKEKGNDINDRD